MQKFFLNFKMILFLIYSLSFTQVNANQCKNLFEDHQLIAVDLQLYDYAQNYANFIEPIQDAINLGLARYQNQKAKGYCYKAVKELLLDSGLVRKEIDGTFASSAHTKNFLVNRGFINLLERAPFKTLIKGALDENIPVGALLVYAGTNGVDGGLRSLGQGVGHIEIKCGPNCYLFDTVADYPGGNNQFKTPQQFKAGDGVTERELIGVYILDYFSLF